MDHINRIGDRVYFRGQIGTIKYSGPLKHTKDQKLKPDDTWIGIQWDDPERGKHKGQVKNIKYFDCDKGHTGSLLRLDTFPEKLDILEAYVKRYFKDAKIMNLLKQSRQQFIEEINKTNTQSEGQNKTDDVQTESSIYVKTSISKKQIKFYGFQDIWSKIEDLSKIQSFSVDKLHVGKFEKENLGNIFKNLKELSLESNLISNWNQVNQLCQWFKKLEFLNLNSNQIYTTEELNSMRQSFVDKFHKDLQIPQNNIQLQTFENLKIVSLSYTNMTCKKLNQIKKLFLNVNELVLSHNNFNDFENLEINKNEFQNLQKLDLSSNNIVSLEKMSKWKIKTLLSLNLHENQLTDFCYLDIFEKLEQLNISKNQIKSIKILHPLSNLKNLVTLKANKNLLSQFLDNYYLKSMYVACLPKLKVLNGGELQKRERRDLEIFYLKNAFHEFFEKFQTDEYNYDLETLNVWIENKFPKIQNFIKIMGSPYPYEDRLLQKRDDDKQTSFVEKLKQKDGKKQEEKEVIVGRNYCLVNILQKVKEDEKQLLSLKLPLTTDFLFIKSYLCKVFSMDICKIKLFVLRNNYKILIKEDLDALLRHFRSNGDILVVNK